MNTTRSQRVERVLATLERASTDAPISTPYLCAAAEAPARRIYLVLREVRMRLASQGRQLCNRRGVGYWIAGCEGDKLDESIKSYRRGLSHLEAGNAALGRVDRARLTAADYEIWGIASGFRAIANALVNGNSEIVRKLADAAATRDRLSRAHEEAKAPLHLLDDPDPRGK